MRDLVFPLAALAFIVGFFAVWDANAKRPPLPSTG
jgi:hypothetical protein